MLTSHTVFNEICSSLQRRGASILCLALCFLWLTSPAGAQEPRIITFDAPGADTTPGDFNGTYPSAINVWGAVTGSYQGADTVLHGFLRNPGGKFTTFEAPGADTTPGSFNGTSPTSINDLGAITGFFTDANGFNHGFLRSFDGKFTVFDVSGVGGYGSFPIAINLEGAIVGYYTDSNFLFHAFLRSPNGVFKTFVGPGACDTGTPAGCYGNEATNINLSGTSVGNFMDDGFVGHGLIRHPDGKLTTFDVPGAGTGIYQGTSCPGCSSGLTQFGAIAGIYSDSNSVNHGFLRSPDGKLTTFDAPGAGTDSGEGTGCPSDCPVSLNDLGALTGIYIDSNFVYHGYLRSPGGKIVTVDPVGTIFTFPVGINDFGLITGYYVDGNDVYHGFLRIPQQ